MNKDVFFKGVRETVFGGKLSQSQVDGIEALLDACDKEGVKDLRQVAYILATPMIETGGTFEPITESLNYSETSLRSKFPRRITDVEANRYGRNANHIADQQAIGNTVYGGQWGADNLGNIHTGDGYLYRGRGLVQTTGRRLYTIFGYADNPEKVATLEVSADIMVRGMRDGTFTGKKLSDYFDGDTEDWRNARRIVNGTDRADDIAGYGRKFYAQLKAAA